MISGPMPSPRMTVMVWDMWGISVQEGAAEKRGAGSKGAANYAGTAPPLQVGGLRLWALPPRWRRPNVAQPPRIRHNIPFRRSRAPGPAAGPTSQTMSKSPAQAAVAGVVMQVSVESTGNLERRMTFQVPAERLESDVGGRLREMARTARIKGFRPGKVPPKVIEQRFGQQVRAEVLEQLLRQEFDSAVRANELRLAGAPRIEPAGDDQLAYVATFEVVPDFGEIDVSKLSVTRHTAEVADEDIDRMIDNLRQQRR